MVQFSNEIWLTFRLTETLYSNEVVKLACRRALVYGAVDYQIVKRICASSAYTLPIEEVILSEYA